MESDEAPPPYSAVDPLLAQSNNHERTVSTESHRPALRGGNASATPDVISSSSGAGDSASGSPVLPFNFTSAAAYFVDRPPTVDDGRNILDHHVTIYPRSQSKDFPRRPRCWNARTDGITQRDWDMFLRYLFPPRLGLASTSGHLPRQLRAEIQRDRKDRPQETDEQRRRRVEFVIAEWNQYFFEPRAARIVFVYVTDPENAPSSPLCPKCYPAATRATQENRSSPVSGPGNYWPTPLPPAWGPPPMPSASNGFVPGPYPYSTPPMTPPFPQPGMPPFPPGGPHDPRNLRMGPAVPHPPPSVQHCPWGWNNQPYSPQSPGFGGSKAGPLGWISQLASQAQKYGERITEQAQLYGDHISARAEHYGRQVEEQAMAHGRWIEDQTGFGGRKPGDAFTGYVGGPGNQWTGQQAYYPNDPDYPNPNMNNRSIELVEVAWQNQPARRSSANSTSSDTSLSSIDSISTTSDLSSSDLATVRAQLLSLNDHHDRELYDAAVGLRRQLDSIQESRRQSHFPRRGPWRNGWWNHNPHDQGYCRGGWGRWESPEEQQQNMAEKRAMKEEMKATKKAFRDVARRAKEEQREQKRARRGRRRQERQSRRNHREEPAQDATEPLEQRLANLELERRPEADAGRRLERPPESHPGNLPAELPASRPRSQSTSSSATSEISIVSTPSATSAENGEASAQSSADKQKSAGSQTKQAESRQKK